MMTWPFKRKPPIGEYRCYWLCLHFASMEELARYLNENHLFTAPPESMKLGRILRGGETLPVCRE